MCGLCGMALLDPGRPADAEQLRRRLASVPATAVLGAKTRLPDFIMLKIDRASMAHSLEVCVPFLDHEVVEFCARIPPSLHMRGRREKHILRRALREVLPRSIVERPKRGLATPVDAWLRGELPGFAEESLSRRRLLDAGYFRPDAVRSLLEGHRAGRGRYGDLLLGVLWIQVWDELVRGECRPTCSDLPAVG